MKLATMLEQIRGNHRYATVDDIRKVFGDYHNVLHWLALFLIGDMRLAEACVVDACSIAETQAALFHEWLIQWAARATLRCALQIQHSQIAEIASEYENRGAVYARRLQLTAEHFQRLIENSKEVHDRLDVLCRFVLVLHGIAKDSCDQVAAQLGVSQNTVDEHIALHSRHSLWSQKMKGDHALEKCESLRRMRRASTLDPHESQSAS